LRLFGRHDGRTCVRADHNLWPVASSIDHNAPTSSGD
jgi:hypothetical protein